MIEVLVFVLAVIVGILVVLAVVTEYLRAWRERRQVQAQLLPPQPQPQAPIPTPAPDTSISPKRLFAELIKPTVAIAFLCFALILLTWGIVGSMVLHWPAWAVEALLIVAIFLFARWLRKCFVVVGTEKTPAMGAMLSWNRLVGVVPPGLALGIWPIQKFRPIPLGPYSLVYKIGKIYSRETEDGKVSSQPIGGTVTLYFQWPRYDRSYAFGGETKNGRELIVSGYYQYPSIDLISKDATVELGKFFEGAILGGIRQNMAGLTHRECREKKAEIEDGIKAYLLSEPGNPFREMCIPAECIDIELTLLDMAGPQGPTEQALFEIEKADRESRASVVRAEREKDAAAHRAEAVIRENVGLSDRLRVLKEAGVPPLIAGPIATGTVGGEKLSTGELRDLIMILGATGQKVTVVEEPERKEGG